MTWLARSALVILFGLSVTSPGLALAQTASAGSSGGGAAPAGGFASGAPVGSSPGGVTSPTPGAGPAAVTPNSPNPSAAGSDTRNVGASNPNASGSAVTTPNALNPSGAASTLAAPPRQGEVATGPRRLPATTAGGSPGARPLSEKERRAEERSKQATKGICQGC
jgi:hypothetical protein